MQVNDLQKDQLNLKTFSKLILQVKVKIHHPHQYKKDGYL